MKLPARAVVDFFFIEEIDASWPAPEKAPKAEGFKPRRKDDGETLIASIGPIPITPETIWEKERIATTIALKPAFYPDGRELAGD